MKLFGSSCEEEQALPRWRGAGSAASMPQHRSVNIFYVGYDQMNIIIIFVGSKIIVRAELCQKWVICKVFGPRRGWMHEKPYFGYNR